MGKLSSHALPHKDELDLKILYELEQDCRRSLEDIAKRTGLSKQTLHYRIARLVEGGVISGFITAIDAAKLGFVQHEVWIQLALLDEKKKQEFIDFLVAHGNVAQVEECQGKYDIRIIMLAENTVRFKSIFKDILKSFPGYVKDYSVAIIFDRIDFPSSYLTDGKQEKRRFMKFDSEPKKIDYDEQDMRVLKGLSENARVPLNELAEAAGISPNTARQRIERLEKEGVIRQYTVSIQPSAIALLHCELMVSAHGLSGQNMLDLEGFCIANRDIVSLRKMVGKWDLGISIIAGDGKRLQDSLIEFRSRFANVIKEFEFAQIPQVHKRAYLPKGKNG